MDFGQCWQAFLRALRTSYDHLGKVVIINLVWFVLGFGPLLLLPYLPVQSFPIWLAALLLSLLAFGGAIPAVHLMINRIVQGQDISAGDFWEGFKTFFVRGSVLFFLRVLGFFILIFNIWVTRSNPSTLYTILAGLWLWGILYWYTMQQFVFPFLVLQDVGIFAVLKKAALVTLDNPLASVFLLVVSLVIVGISVLAIAPVALFTAGLLAVLQNSFYSGIMLKYDRKEDSVVER